MLINEQKIDKQTSIQTTKLRLINQVRNHIYINYKEIAAHTRYEKRGMSDVVSA